MNRFLFPALLAATALLLTACPQTSPPPVNPSECPVGPLEVQGEEPLRLQGFGQFAGEYVPGELLVLPKAGFSVQAWQAEGVEPLEALPRGLLRVKVPPGQEKARAQALLRAGAQYVQPNYIYRPLRVPNDPYYLWQKAYLNGLVGLEAAWAHSTGRGCPPLIAILDTGILPHEDVRASLYLPQAVKLDVADDDTDPTDRTDSPGHGLMVASVLGADTNNNLGMAGVTWGGYILPVKIFKDGATETSTADITKGVNLARTLGARVINLSIGARNVSDPVLENAISQARASGAVVVAAAGNDGDYGVYFPASLPSVIAVGAVDNAKERASFSTYGPELDLVAPGVDVVGAGSGGGYPQGSGTSFASPVVAGVVALYMSKYASGWQVWPTPDQVRQCLTGTAEDLGTQGRDHEYGFGLVRADRVMTDTTYCFP
ncbi:S8 family peptidase [Thermus scotoductus]|uniref:Serine protease n=1 Tax=Thermus scotoductus TaxID=37636 RepID=A0A430RU86_THESC|nr:S8 family serine peptidase [Thermus scotoductus]RTH23234.1 serine protease [Thermus scotoductus]RTI40491.1 serine protease [Thermus scotoductus]